VTSDPGQNELGQNQARAPQALPTGRSDHPQELLESGSGAATYTLLLGLASVLLFIVPSPLPLLVGAVAVVFGLYALVRIMLQPSRHSGTPRALVGICLGLFATIAIWPWLDMIRYNHRRAVCQANLLGVAAALQDYHAEWKAYPADLQTLIESGHTTAGQCQCFIEDDIREAWADFGYVRGFQPDDPGDWVWLYDDPANHAGRGGLILYLNREVEHLSPEEFQAELQRFRVAFEQMRGHAPVIVAPH